jgi:hypothetical protein
MIRADLFQKDNEIFLLITTHLSLKKMCLLATASKSLWQTFRMCIPPYHSDNSSHCMFLTDISNRRDEILETIFANLDLAKIRMLSTVSKSLSVGTWTRMPSHHTEITNEAQMQALALFDKGHSYGSPAQLGSDVVMKIARIANTKIRQTALKRWADDQEVRVDQDGFYVQNTHYNSFGKCKALCVRINIWDSPFDKKKTVTSEHFNRFLIHKILKPEFLHMGFDPVE